MKEKNKTFKKVRTPLILIIIAVSVMIFTNFHFAQAAKKKVTKIHMKNKVVDLPTMKRLLKTSQVENPASSNSKSMKTIKNLAEKGTPDIKYREKKGYIKKDVIARPSLLTTDGIKIDYGTEIVYHPTSNPQYVAVYSGTWRYIKKSSISSHKMAKRKILKVSTDRRKSYMDYRTITDTTSKQYKLQHSKGYTDKNGLRKVNGRFCIAVGSAYTRSIGKKIDVILKNGNKLKCILSDQKKNVDTNSSHTIGADGGAVEFLVDTLSLNSTVRKTGDVGYTKSITTSPVKYVIVYQ